MMYMARTIMESHHMADGGIAEVAKLGRTYTFMRAYPSGAPDCIYNLKKQAALAMLADAIKSDVCDIDE